MACFHSSPAPGISIWHRLDAQLCAQAAHRQGAEPVSIGQVDRGAQHPVGGQARPGSGGLAGHHVDKLTK
jgi:hypothetical protein